VGGTNYSGKHTCCGVVWRGVRVKQRVPFHKRYPLWLAGQLATKLAPHHILRLPPTMYSSAIQFTRILIPVFSTHQDNSSSACIHALLIHIDPVLCSVKSAWLSTHWTQKKLGRWNRDDAQVIPRRISCLLSSVRFIALIIMYFRSLHACVYLVAVAVERHGSPAFGQPRPWFRREALPGYGRQPPQPVRWEQSNNASVPFRLPRPCSTATCETS